MSGARRERRRGRRESDLALLSHLAEVLAEDPEAVSLHTGAVLARMEPAAWAWAGPSGPPEGAFERFDPEAARRAEGTIFPAADCPWLSPAEGFVHRVVWPDGEVFVMARPPEVPGAERWEAYLVRALAGLLRLARREAARHARPRFTLYAEAEGETMAMLGREVERTKRLDLPLAALFVRLHGAKVLNETRGLAEGDRAFARLGVLLYRRSGETARMGRAGTDGFLLVFPGGSRREVERWFEESQPEVTGALRAEFGTEELSLEARAAEIPADGETAEALVAALGIPGRTVSGTIGE